LKKRLNDLQLLERNPKKRLGCGPKDAEEIKKHPFFKDIDWDKLDKKLLEPPFRPALVLPLVLLLLLVLLTR
jgi:hypothetical protein